MKEEGWRDSQAACTKAMRRCSEWSTLMLKRRGLPFLLAVTAVGTGNACGLSGNFFHRSVGSFLVLPWGGEEAVSGAGRTRALLSAPSSLRSSALPCTSHAPSINGLM